MEEDAQLKGDTLKKFIKVSFHNQIEFLNSILYTAKEIMDYGNTIEYKTGSISREVIAVLHANAFTTFYAIITLCEEGFDKDALSLVRNIMEINFITSFILKEETEERSKYYLYNEYLLHEKQKNARIDHIDEEQRKKIDKLLQQRIDETPEENRKYIDKNTNPFSKTIKYIAIRAGKKMIYDIWYRYLCNFSHPNSVGIKNYVKGNADIENTIKIMPGRHHEKVKEALNYASLLYLEILEQFCNHLDLNKKEVMNLLKEKRHRMFSNN